MIASESALFYKVLEKYKQDPLFVAYVMATVKHETAGTFEPIEERGTEQYLSGRYWNKPHIRAALGNKYPSDALLYKGRGYVQLTGRANYRRVGQKIGVDLLSRPESAQDADNAFLILTDGMMEGWFTGLGFARIIKMSGADRLLSLRAIVNGMDKAVLIGEYAKSYLEDYLSVDTSLPYKTGKVSLSASLTGHL